MTGRRAIAVVGVAGRFPGAPDVETLWENVVANRSAARDVAADRWPVPAGDVVSARRAGDGGADRALGPIACALDDFGVDDLHAGLLLPASLWPRLDRLARLTLRVGVDAWRSVRSTLDAERTRVILANIALPTEGASALAEELFLGAADRAVSRPRSHAPPGRGEPLDAFPSALPAGLLARALGLGGGSFTLDAACASSLYAIDLACGELEAGRANAVLCGGVSLPQSLYTQVGFTQLQALSPTGVCAPYDASADGLVVGEGAAMFVLKRLDDARRDGDAVLGVIRGIGLSNDVGGSLLSPDTEGQLRAMRAAYAQAGWRPDDVDLVEGHGTGTPRGDAVERASLAAMWSTDGSTAPSGRACALGSVKGNVGHLLTAAGAAGLSKVLAALRDAVLPPSVHASTGPASAENGAGSAPPFRVLRTAEPWARRAGDTPRRAAVSGFGFGGINAHLLIEEDLGGAAGARPAVHAARTSPPAVAIVGLAAHIGRLDSLAVFQRAVLAGEPVRDALPRERWHGLELDAASPAARLRALRGAFIADFALPAGRFKLAPNDVPSLLPQQLLMLDVARDALLDAGWSGKGPHPRAGVVIGLGLDLETTSFHLRWLAQARARRWATELGLALSDLEIAAWGVELADALAAPLDATRTLGALGGMVPSRIAREFGFGGPSFAVADDEASGLRAFEVAVRLLERGEVDTMVAGAVDLACDVRAIVAKDRLGAYSPSSDARPFDSRADGSKVAEGAAAVVLKRLEDAVAAGDRVYAVLRGFGAAGGGALDVGRAREDAYARAAAAAYRDAEVAPSRVSLVETHGSGVAAEDAVELRALARVFADEGAGDRSVALSSTAGITGQAGAAASMASLVKTALCLHQQVLPPLGDIASPSTAIDWARTPFHLPRRPEAWLRDRADGARLAAVSSMGSDGSCLHAVLSEPDDRETHVRRIARGQSSRARPLGERGAGLFLLRGPDGGVADGARLRAVAEGASGLESVACLWYRAERGAASTSPVARAIVATDPADLLAQIAQLARAPRALSARSEPGSLALVFPGSGNHWIGMGHGLALALPDVYRRLDGEVLHLAGHLQPRWVTPRRVSWTGDWEDDALRDFAAHPERVIVAQVAHSVAVHDALVHLGVVPDAYVGYSLGESAALFASRAWRDRDLMFARTMASPLFRSELAGEMSVLKSAWGADATWQVVIVNRPAALVRASLVGTVALLIVNAPGECVLGGTAGDVVATVARLGCEALPLGGVPTVHLPLVLAVRDAYRAHHTLPTTAPPGVRFYSGAWARAYDPTEATSADSVTDNAEGGFDFAAVVEQAWADGVRTFVEVGPQSSCTRMIARILEGRPHVAVSAGQPGREEYASLLAAVARVAEAGGRVELEALYGEQGGIDASPSVAPARLPPVALGGIRRPFPLGPRARVLEAVTMLAPSTPRRPSPLLNRRPELSAFFAAAEATAAAHETFLRTAHEALALQGRLIEDAHRARARVRPEAGQPARFERAACMEFAVGQLAKVLGPSFAEVDTFPTRVRLPDEPLMLVDRIVLVEGPIGGLGPGRVVTEHDVLDNAWYLDGDRAPVCISVEAGQADLFLSSYLGIDKETRGERVYRLLDAKIVFHRDLPRPGERIRYDIQIDRFIRQGDTWLFFFRFDGTVEGRPFISMFDGCAGFFSAEQLAVGRGIVPRSSVTKALRHPGDTYRPLVLGGAPRTTLQDFELDALRRGDLGAAFGGMFAGKTMAPALRLPGGRMKLVDRILSLDLEGGPGGLGEVVGEADVTPDAWYLICHFVDDQVMPGTLMYECCLHTLRVLLCRMGWISSDSGRDLHYAPVPGVASELRCRGQVTGETKKVRYQVTIDEAGYRPEPYVIATASMFADGKHVVQMERMSVELQGLAREDLEAEWLPPEPMAALAPAFDRARIVAYADGKPSDCFGDPYLPFDPPPSELGHALDAPLGSGSRRRLARLPRDPYLFLDRVLTVEPPPWVLAPGGWVTCAFDVKPDAWYFAASRQRTMPFAVLLEAALQPCGWLAAYVGSALTSEADLHFRNLDGTGVQHCEVGPDAGTLTSRARMTKTSQAGGSILQEFDIEVWAGSPPRGALVYAGQTGFGFFPRAALAAQVGVRGRASWASSAAHSGFALPRERPLTPDDTEASQGERAAGGLALPARALSMIDRIVELDLTGGPAGLGLVVGEKRVDPEEWFFRAHFFEDPVMPGSLGLEALLELAKFFACERFRGCRDTHRFEAMAVGRPHRWQYRGQVVPRNEHVRVEARVTSIVEGAQPTIVLDGQLAVDDKIIYAMADFAIRLVPEERP